jgi:glutamyl-tRNA synthetase
VGGDFVVARSNGSISYQLAVVCDDAAMGVTGVIRGDDLVPSTPRQILLYRAFGWREPSFGHVGLAVGPDDRRLAKRDGSVKLSTLRAAGADPRSLIGRIARSCGVDVATGSVWPGDLIGAFPSWTLPRGTWAVGDEG